MSEPTSQPPAAEAEKRKQEERELTRAHKRLWATEDGRRILADLEKRTNFDKGPYAHGIGHGDLAYRCGTQDPVRYIREQLAKVLTPLGKKVEKKTAKSGSARTQ